MPKLYPSVAVSDAFFAGCLFYGARALQSSIPSASLGLLLVASAAGAGVLRFGFQPRIFTKYNESLARLAANVGFPLLGLAFTRQIPQIADFLAPYSDLHIATALIFSFVVIQQTPSFVEHYETVLNAQWVLAAIYLGAHSLHAA